ncbi:MAG: sigma-54 dependent transcriptional regulator [Kangiellaceae bacterium]|jgi:DNA-binding NtrC family response regulator|nr:sigma-54 dependent transcriptional regulator [Kangiellaceae bacterium]
MSTKDKSVRLLVVDDDASVTASIALLLKQHGYSALTASSPQEAMEQIELHNISVVLQDMNFSRNTTGEEGMALLKTIKSVHADLPVILMTAWGSIELAVEGIKHGAADFLTKPWSNQQLLSVVETCLQLQEKPAHSGSTKQLSRTELDNKYDFSNIIGDDPAMLDVLAAIGRVAATDAPVLILGESGTGKELIADAIHKNSKRHQNDIVKVNLGGMNATLFESEMFGHVRGAFTDAKHDRVGRFEVADKGTIFLDELGDLDPSSQVKLLRVLQDQSYQQVGSSVSKKSNVRVISATNRDLYDMVKQGSFREDLLYRINLITINLPPLRKRRGDIPALANKHLAKVRQLYSIDNVEISAEAMSWLQQQPWPGNVRQLTQTVERAVLMSGSTLLSTADFKTQDMSEQDAQSGPDQSLDIGHLTLDEMEKLMIEKALSAYNSNISRVAEALGISRAALYRRLEKYGITP